MVCHRSRSHWLPMSKTPATLPKLKTTIEHNLPAILLTAKTKGPLAVRALAEGRRDGQAVVDHPGTWAARQSRARAPQPRGRSRRSASMSVSVSASTSVSSSCTKNSS